MAHTHNVLDDTNPVKVLGLWWDTLSDTISAAPKSDASMFTMLATKREILKWISGIFDLLGLISPVTITAKLFLQNLWEQNLNWDTKLNEDLSQTWYEIAVNIIPATTMPFPHWCIAIEPSAELTVHIFTDASPRAY